MPGNKMNKQRNKNAADLELDAFLNDTDEKELANKDDAIDTPVEIAEVAKEAEEKKEASLEQLQAAIDELAEEEVIAQEENQQELEEYLEDMEYADDDIEEQSNKQELADHIQNQNMEYVDEAVTEPLSDEQITRLSATLRELGIENDTNSEPAADNAVPEQVDKPNDLKKFEARISEIHQTETTFIDSVLKLREPLAAMQSMKNPSASDEAYKQLNDLVTTIETLHKKYPENLNSVLNMKNGKLEINQTQFMDYVSTVQKAADISEKYINSGQEANILKDFAEVKTGLKANDLTTAAIAPAQRGARYEMLLEAAMPNADTISKKHLTEAHKSVKQVLATSWEKKKEPISPLSREDFKDRMNQIGKLASKLSITSGTIYTYADEFRKIKELMHKGSHMEAVDIHVQRILNAADKAVAKTENKTFYSQQNKEIHQEIKNLAAKIMHDATDPKNQAMLKGIEPSPPRPQPPKTHMTFTESFRNPAVESLREARDFLRAAIAESKKENPDPKAQNELLSKADFALQGAKTKNAMIETKKGETSQVKATKEIIDHLQTGIEREMKLANQSSPGRKG